MTLPNGEATPQRRVAVHYFLKRPKTPPESKAAHARDLTTTLPEFQVAAALAATVFIPGPTGTW